MKRWSFDVQWMGMYPDENGPWVQADDVISESTERDAARAERDAARAESDKLRDVLTEWVERYQYNAPARMVEDAEAALRKTA